MLYWPYCMHLVEYVTTYLATHRFRHHLIPICMLLELRSHFPQPHPILTLKSYGMRLPPH